MDTPMGPQVTVEPGPLRALLRHWQSLPGYTPTVHFLLNLRITYVGNLGKFPRFPTYVILIY